MTTANSINCNSTGIVTYDNPTASFTGSPVTQYAALAGDANNKVSSVVSAVDGYMLIGHTASNPVFADTCPISFNFTQNTAGITETLTVSNLDNTNAASAAKVEILSGGNVAGDPYLAFDVIATGDNCSLGLDNSDSRIFKISYNATLGTNDTVLVDATGGKYKGYADNTAPSAGFIGEQIQSAVAMGASVPIVMAAVAQDLTSINLTAGVWDVSLITIYDYNVNIISPISSISLVSATNGNLGDNAITGVGSNSGESVGLVVPAYRILLNAPTTVYAVIFATNFAGTADAYGRISAVRVA